MDFSCQVWLCSFMLNYLWFRVIHQELERILDYFIFTILHSVCSRLNVTSYYWSSLCLKTVLLNKLLCHILILRFFHFSNVYFPYQGAIGNYFLIAALFARYNHIFPIPLKTDVIYTGFAVCVKVRSCRLQKWLNLFSSHLGFC